MNIETLRLLLRCQPARAYVGRPHGGDWEYLLFHGDDRRWER
jgi:hypothetical protein